MSLKISVFFYTMDFFETLTITKIAFYTVGVFGVVILNNIITPKIMNYIQSNKNTEITKNSENIVKIDTENVTQIGENANTKEKVPTKNTENKELIQKPKNTPDNDFPIILEPVTIDPNSRKIDKP